MGYGNKSVSGIHPILKHMNKLGGNPEIKYDPIAHDEKGMGRGGKLGTAEYGKMKDGMPAYGKKSHGMPKHGKMHNDGMGAYGKMKDGMPAYGKKGEGMPMHKGYPHKKNTISGGGVAGQDRNIDSYGNVSDTVNKRKVTPAEKSRKKYK